MDHLRNFIPPTRNMLKDKPLIFKAAETPAIQGNAVLAIRRSILTLCLHS